MKQVQKVWEQLASQKVELSKIQDLKALAQEARSLPSFMEITSDLDRISGMLNEMTREARRVVTDARSITKEYGSLVREIEATAKELGVSYNDLGIQNDMEALTNVELDMELYEALDAELPIAKRAIDDLMM